MKRLLYWFALTPGLLLLVVCASDHPENAGLVRVAKLAVWTSGLLVIGLCPFVVVFTSIWPDKFKLEKRLRTVPLGLQIFLDLCIAGFCAYAGWMWTAAIAVLDFICWQISMAFIEQANKTAHEKDNQ